MKRFMLILLSCTALLLCGSFLFFTVGIYIPSGSDEITGLPFRTEGTLLKHQREDGEYVPFTIRGVEVSSSMPGHYATEFHAEKEDYLRWFEQIARMGANTVKALQIMDDDFYNALYEYNQEGGLRWILSMDVRSPFWAVSAEAAALISGIFPNGSSVLLWEVTGVRI